MNRDFKWNNEEILHYSLTIKNQTSDSTPIVNSLLTQNFSHLSNRIYSRNDVYFQGIVDTNVSQSSYVMLLQIRAMKNPSLARLFHLSLLFIKRLGKTLISAKYNTCEEKEMKAELRKGFLRMLEYLHSTTKGWITRKSIFTH